MRNTYLVCYDISNDLRLRRVHKTMRGFGDHLQYSVFEWGRPRCRWRPRSWRDSAAAQPRPLLKRGLPRLYQEIHAA